MCLARLLFDPRERICERKTPDSCTASLSTCSTTLMDIWEWNGLRAGPPRYHGADYVPGRAHSRGEEKMDPSFEAAIGFNLELKQMVCQSNAQLKTHLGCMQEE
nr:hypothetical protein Itr_chr01CG09640 [Ipomoea trifida]